MKIAIIGTEGSLRTPVANNMGRGFACPVISMPIKETILSLGVKSLDVESPVMIFKMLDHLMQHHSKIVNQSNGTVICDMTSIDILAYYLYFCAASEDVEQSRAVVQNCARFAQNYNQIFLIGLSKNNFEQSESFFGGNLPWEYSLEYMMRGILSRFHIRHHVVEADTLEDCIAIMGEKL